LLVIFNQWSLSAGTVTLDFEGFSDSTILTTQYPGLTFSNTIILTAGISLNEFELPPRSGSNVAFDNNGPISIVFDSPVLSFGGFFTYALPLTLAAFDATSTQVDSSTSAFFSNLAQSGDIGSSPNEFLSVSSLGGISSVTITGDPGGTSFALDDATITTADAGGAGAPEPATFPFLVAGSLVLIGLRKFFNLL
jgi:hypothetical protein